MLLFLQKKKNLSLGAVFFLLERCCSFSEAKEPKRLLCSWQGGAALVLAFLTGLRQEARLLAPLGCPVYVGGGTPGGAALAARRAIEDRVEAIVSFGLAGALDPKLSAGSIILAETVVWNGRRFATDEALTETLGGATAPALVCWNEAVSTAAHKAALQASSGAVAVDLESGPMAEAAEHAGIRFAVLRAICDTAETSLTWAAMDALDAAGRIRLGQVAGRVLRRPAQLPAMLALARDAARARSALTRVVSRLAENPGLAAQT